MSDKTIKDKSYTFRFSAIDTLFFRESRPMEAMGELQSVFPPSMRTLSGAIRRWIGEEEGIDWQDFSKKDCKKEQSKRLRDLMGNPYKTDDADQTDDLGQLHFQGAWLTKKEQRLYPAPLHLMKKKDKKTSKITLFQLELSEKGYDCDLGEKVRFAQLPKSLGKDAKGSKPLSKTWIDAETLKKLLEGKEVQYSKKHFFSSECLFSREARIGIAMNKKLRAVEKGLLYQTQHIRPKTNVAIEADVIRGLTSQYKTGDSIIRLGGEGRSANLSVTPFKDKALPQAELSESELEKGKGLMLYLLTPLLIKQDDETWQPLPDFDGSEALENEQTMYWKGSLNGITLKLHGAITGKAIREGGWDLARHRPRSMRSFIPAGSVFFCEPVDLTIDEAITQLHNTQIGELQQYGYGHIVAGLWT